MKSNRERQRRNDRIVLLVGTPIILLMIPRATLGLFAPLLDNLDVQTKYCNILDAHASRSGGGRSATVHVVAIRTRDCGKLAWTQGVNSETEDRIARTFSPGLYRVEMGWYSRTIVPFSPNGLASIHSYEFVGPLSESANRREELTSAASTLHVEESLAAGLNTSAQPDQPDADAAIGNAIQEPSRAAQVQPRHLDD